MPLLVGTGVAHTAVHIAQRASRDQNPAAMLAKCTPRLICTKATYRLTGALRGHGYPPTNLILPAHSVLSFPSGK